MSTLIPALLLVLQAAPTARTPTLQDAYLDATARELVTLARQRSQASDSSITAYRTVAREKMSVGLRALRRDRILFRREVAADVLWRRDGVGRVQLLGAREVVPVAAAAAEVPRRASREAAQLAFDPGSILLLQGIDGGDTTSLRNPLSAGSEAFYRFGTGDTTRVRLSESRVLRLVELRVHPRDPRRPGVRGSIWLDLDTHAPVRAVFRLNRPVDLLRDLDEDDEDIPGILRPVELHLRYLTIDYGLWEGRWWLPRLLALEGEARFGRMANLPVRFERSYADFQVEGEGTARPLAALADSLLADTAGTASAEEAEKESEGGSGVSVSVRRRCQKVTCWEYRVARPADSVLLHGEHLPGSIYSEGTLVSDRELEELGRVLSAGLPGQTPWHRPVVRHSLLSPGLMRYNRVEGLSLAGRVNADFGAAEADATLRLGLADLQPAFELGVAREGFASRQRVAAYRRLASVDPDPRPMALGSSLSALVLGRDDAEYYRTLGSEVGGITGAAGGWEARWRLFAERQSEAEKSTDLSLPRLLGRAEGFAENLSAAGADQVGAALALGISRGLDPTRFRWRGEAALLASAGDFAFARPALTVGVGFPLSAGAVAAIEMAGGTAFGTVPVQSEWLLGGPGTVRGYGADSRVRGQSFWRTRAELARSSPAARLVAFTDAGWAGDRGSVVLDPPLLSAGVGVSVLDGLLRLDLARALRGERGWRLELHMDAPL